MMTATERHQKILELLKTDTYISVVELSEILRVSVVTIRKDLSILESKGLVYKTHGGVSLESPYVSDRSVSIKKLEQIKEKDAIALAAIKFIQPNDAIIIGSGTTVESFANNIPVDIPLTVLTAAMNISMQLVNHKEIQLVQLGGIVRKSSRSVVGSFTEEMLNHFNCKTLFIGVDGISAENGITTSNMMEAHLNAQMICKVQRTVVLVDSSKFDKQGFGKIADIDAVDIVITDKNIPNKYKQYFSKKGIQLIIVN